jgi:phosphoribosylamine--glycine ligase
MRVLVVGNGAREHAIAWKLSQSPRVEELFVAPGNAGTAQLARNVPIRATDIEGLLRFAQESRIAFTVVGPEAPLAAGIVNRFQEAGLPIFGPTKEAARIESSKSFAKELMLRHGVPTAAARAFSTFAAASDYALRAPLPVVVKADGLASGKGVVVARTREEAIEALRQQMVEKQFGAAGERVLIEECLEGQEVSVFAFVEGERVSPLLAACDYKRVGDGDVGPNTGGMGSYSPPPFWDEELEGRIRKEIMGPVARALCDEGCPYRGVLYAGLMLTNDGPKVIEFNCRLGDPEAQVVLPRLKTDLLDIMMRTAQGSVVGVNDPLGRILKIEWDSRACVGVVIASGGYPGRYETGFPIEGLNELDDDITVFHAGTKLLQQEGKANAEVVTDGGRILTVTALGPTLEDARRRVYANVGRIRFKGSFYRKDIAAVDGTR